MSWWEPLLGIRSSSPPPPAAAAKDHEDLIPDPEDTALTTSSEVGDGSYNISPFFFSFFFLDAFLLADLSNKIQESSLTPSERAVTCKNFPLCDLSMSLSSALPILLPLIGQHMCGGCDVCVMTRFFNPILQTGR